MILAVCGDKGAPGATTLAMLLALCWPTATVLTEVDVRGCDLPLRLHTPDGPILERPSVTSFAVDARPGMPTPSPDRYTQATTLGVAFIPGELTPRAQHALAPHLPAAQAAAAAWRGLLIADLGVVSTANPAMVFARHAALTVLVTRADVSGLARLPDVVETLTDLAADAGRDRPPVAVVVRADAADCRAAQARASTVLATVGSPVSTIGAIPTDDKAVAALWSGALGRRFAKTPLHRATVALTAELTDGWPALRTQVEDKTTDADAPDHRDGLAWPALTHRGGS